VDAHIDVQVPRLSMPIGWVVTLVVFIAGGAISVASVWFRGEARADQTEAALKTHAEDQVKHLSPEVTKDGGVVTKKTLRVVLRRMTINCKNAKLEDGSTGLACSVKIPEEAE
jgi:hypothetical protein